MDATGLTRLRADFCMAKSSVVARVLDGDRLECRIVSIHGDEVILTGGTKDLEPAVEGSSTVLSGNPTLLHNAWAYAQYNHLKVNLPTEAEQQSAEKHAEAHHDVAAWIADVAGDLTEDGRIGWCSACFTRSSHRKARVPRGGVPAYVCTDCGSPTLPCVGPGCMNMAVRGRGTVRVPRYCAEHRHDIPGFEKANRTIGDLEEYEQFRQNEKRNLSRNTKLTGAAVAAIPGVGALAFFAAPAIGGAVGSLIGGYSGAAATSYGLALLGGGSLAAGGLGMAGGTAVITAVGGALGCALGASVTNAYLREDKSFHIEKLRSGDDVPVVLCNGFLTENGRGWGDWEGTVTARYPDSPVYRVHWGAKELKDLAALVGTGTAKVAGFAGLKRTAMQATRAGAAKISPLSPALIGADLAKNPWHVAKNRADKTGVVIADLLARTESRSYVLVGHSLGARAMVVAAQTLGSKPDGPRIQAAHLLGAAIGAKSDWGTLTSPVDDAVYNYHSTNDAVLKLAYKIAQGGQTAAGLSGFHTSTSMLHNIDVSAEVAKHSDYPSRVTLL